MKKVLCLCAATLMLAGCGNESTAPVSSDRPTINIFGMFPSRFSEQDNAVIKRMEEANNVTVKFEVPPSTSYQERLQIMLVSGSYPDLVLFLSNTEKSLIDSVKNGVVIPINQYLTEENAPNLLKYTYDISWDAMKVNNDKGIYGIPRTTILRSDGFAVRGDWLKNVGLTLPEDGVVTIDEFTEILKRFTLNDPDGDGKDNTFGIAAGVDSRSNMLPCLLYPFGNLFWQKTDTDDYPYMNPMYSRKSSAFKDAIRYSAQLFEDGYMDQNALVNKGSDAISERFFQGVAGVIPAFAGHAPTYLETARNVNKDAELSFITGVKNKDGELIGSAQGGGFYGLYAVTKSSLDPALAVKVMDWTISDEGWDLFKYGVEGVSYTKEGDQLVKIESNDPFNLRGPFLRRNNDPDYFLDAYLDQDTRENVLGWLEKAIEQCVPSEDRGFKPEIAGDSKFVEGNNQLARIITRIITGDLPVEEYDKALDDWYASGGETYVNQMNDYIKTVSE